jgi:hypothetical protein
MITKEVERSEREKETTGGWKGKAKTPPSEK